MMLGAVAFLLLAAQAQPARGAEWRTVTYPEGREMRYVPPEIRDSDYPASALRRAAEGRTLVRLVLSPVGQVVECHVHQSSGHPDLDAKSCEIYRLRARFDLRNFTANHTITAPVTWRLSAAPPPAPTPAGAIVGFMSRRAGAAPLPVSAGQTFEVTEDMVTQFVPSDFFPLHKTELVLRGRAGDRFALSWEAPGLVQVTHPNGDIEPGSYTSVEIALARDGENRVLFSQPHRFRPFSLLVRRLP